MKRVKQRSPITSVGVFFSSGDLGDVGRHVVEALLELGVANIRVFSSQIELLEDRNWHCGCVGGHSVGTRENREKITLVRLDCTKETLLARHLQGLDAVISCLGHRTPFAGQNIAKTGTEHILKAIDQVKIPRFVLLSSVGIGNDWPPMEWSREGERLAGRFRTICWTQYQDLSGAELAVRKHATGLDFLIVRAVLLPETMPPSHRWTVQSEKFHDHPHEYLSKMDCARFLVQEVVQPTLNRCAVVLGDAT